MKKLILAIVLLSTIIYGAEKYSALQSGGNDVITTVSSLADLTTRSAGDLSSGNLPIARMPVSGNWELTGDLNISGGNVGVGVTPESWDPIYSVLQLGGTGSLFTETTPAAGGRIYMMNNAYYDDTNNRWQYIIADEASYFSQANGEFTFGSVVPGSNPDDEITWTSPKMTINSAGNVGIGVSPSYKLDVANDAATTLGMRIKNSSATGYSGIQFDNNLSTGSGVVYLDNDAGKFIVGGNTGVGLSIITNTTEAIGIDASQNVDFAGTTINMTTSGTTLTVGTGADNGTVSAGVFTDRTRFYDGNAIQDIMKIKGKNGHIDHKSLPTFAYKTANIKIKDEETGEETIIVEEQRDLGAMISILTKGMQEQQAQIEALKARIEILENK